MTKTRSLALLLTLSGVAALPACSMFGGSRNTSQTSGTTSTASPAYAAAPNYNTGAPAGMTQTAELTPDTIRSVQQTLQQDGMYRGRVDGVWGPGTQAGVRSFQQQHNLSATGQLDQPTLAAMNMPGNQSSAPGNGAPNYNPPPDSNNPTAAPPR